MNFGSELFLIGLGLFVGSIGTLIGAGGGFILVPLLLLLHPQMSPEIVTSISLGIVFVNACSGSFAYAKMKRIDYKSAFSFALATLPGAVIGALITSSIPRSVFNFVLGILLIIISVYLLIHPKQNEKIYDLSKKGTTKRLIYDKNNELYEYSFNIRLGIIISFFVGFLSSLLGIGGGIIHVPALTGLLNFPVHIATATSHFILMIMALAGTIVHIIQGNFKGNWFTTFYIGIGVIAGAQIGAILSKKIKGEWIVRGLAIALFLVGLRLLMH